MDTSVDKRSLSKPSVPCCLRSLIAAWLIAVTLEYLLLPKELRSLAELSGIANMSGFRMICVTAVLTILGIPASRYRAGRFAVRWALVYAFAVYATCSIINSFTWPFFGVCVLVLAVLMVYAVCGWNQTAAAASAGLQKGSKLYPLLAILFSAAFFCLVSAWTVARVRSFGTPTYDFGIFSQMFYSMKETGLPMTTVERDGMLSHFAVHVSPIYYLMLPIFCLVPRPETLQVLQAAVLASAVLPLWKLGKHHGLHPAARLFVCILLLLYPAYSGGTSYDLHENCFLAPLILWLLYGIDRKNAALTAAAAILTLMVKEDAAVYVAVIALYLLLRSCLHREKWGLVSSCLLLAGAVVWFLAVTTYLANQGDGVMNYRYRNFMYDGSQSLVTVIKAVLLCPMKAVFECVDGEKLKFIGLTMLPLLGLPLITRRYERYLLLIPYLLINLMSDYTYQHDIMYQYTFGSTACLFYLVVVNLSDWKIPQSNLVILGLALCISFGCFREMILPTAKYYVTNYTKNEAYYSQQKELLDTIPDGVSVAASTYYTTYLSDHSQLFDIRHSSQEHILSCEYIVFKVSDSGSFKNYAVDGKNGKENFVNMLLENGYVLLEQSNNVTEIYRKFS